MTDWHEPRTWLPGDVRLTAPVLNYELRDELNALYDLVQALYDDIATDWTDATLAGSWVNRGGSEAPAGYRRVGKQVYLRGVVESGSIPGDIFTLPIGYRPAYFSRFLVLSDVTLGNPNGYSRITIASGGTVHISDGSDGVQLDGISFRTA